MSELDSIQPVTVLKTRAAELIRRARESGRPIVITQNGKATAVLQDAASYQRERETLLLLRYLARGDQDYRRGRHMTDAGADRHFRAKLQSLNTID